MITIKIKENLALIKTLEVLSLTMAFPSLQINDFK
jgi:hypothetical protein